MFRFAVFSHKVMMDSRMSDKARHQKRKAIHFFPTKKHYILNSSNKEAIDFSAYL